MGGATMSDGKYRVSGCSICGQGWVEIVKDKVTHELFVCCTECESEWALPDAVKSANLSTQGKYGETVEPEFEDIVREGWINHILKK